MGWLALAKNSIVVYLLFGIWRIGSSEDKNLNGQPQKESYLFALELEKTYREMSQNNCEKDHPQDKNNGTSQEKIVILI